MQVNKELRPSVENPMDDLILIGDVMIGLVHRLNNSLNAILLQTALLKHKAPETFAEDLDVIRDAAREAATLVRPLVQVRDRRRSQEEKTNVLETLRDLHGEISGWEVASEAKEAWLRIPQTELKRLLIYLLRIAASTGLPFRVRTGSLAGEGEICLEAMAAESELNDWLNGEDGEGRSCPLERLAVRGLVRQFEGKLEKTSDSAGMPVLRLILPAAS
jgi:hypothetical protein